MASLLVSWGAGVRVMEGTFTAGQKADLVIADEYASTVHARFTPVAGGWAVEDMGSANGTWLNGTQRVYGPASLVMGDKVRIGRTVLTVVPVEPAAPLTTQDCPDDAPDGTCWDCGAHKSRPHREDCATRIGSG